VASVLRSRAACIVFSFVITVGIRIIVIQIKD